MDKQDIMTPVPPAAAPVKSSPNINTLNVDLGRRSYDIKIGAGLIDNTGSELKSLLRRPRTFVVSDRNVADLYLDRVSTSLRAEGIEHNSMVLPAGESSKSFATLEKLLDSMLEARLERSDMIVALGGGVIGDLAGFAASILLRGIDFVQIPTTLLAQVDSSVGGKTGVNTPHGKNLIGNFHQPRLVLADTAVLDTLSPRQFLAGYAEVVKYGLIEEIDFFTWLEEKGPALIAGDMNARQQAVRRSCAAKARMVSADEREQGRRAMLNFGHTFGHALEAETGFGDDLYHGEAVAMGMKLAFELSTHLGFCPREDTARASAHLDAVGLPDISSLKGKYDLTAEKLLAHMSQDKKVKNGIITFVLTYGIGKAFLKQDVDNADVLTVLNAALEK